MPYRTPRDPCLKFLVLAGFWAVVGLAGVGVLLVILMETGVVDTPGGMEW